MANKCLFVYPLFHLYTIWLTLFSILAFFFFFLNSVEIQVSAVWSEIQKGKKKEKRKNQNYWVLWHRYSSSSDVLQFFMSIENLWKKNPNHYFTPSSNGNKNKKIVIVRLDTNIECSGEKKSNEEKFVLHPHQDRDIHWLYISIESKLNITKK